MEAGPVGTPVDAEEAARLRAERDEWQRRCVAAETEVIRLADELERTRHQIDQASDDGALSLFEGAADEAAPAGDGSDARVFSLILGATAVVAGMVALLALLNGKLASPIGVIMVALAVGLAWGAARTRVVPVEVTMTRGVVSISKGDSSYRFDLRRPETAVEMVGRPGESGWQVRFPRRHLEPFVIDDSMVDAYEFTQKLREFRPDL